MDMPPKYQQPYPQVSLRGASAKEISRDALLQRVTRERHLRSSARRAASAALFIQRVWRRYDMTNKVAKQLEKAWDSVVGEYDTSKTSRWISKNLLKSFIFFTALPQRKLRPDNIQRMSVCFKILLESINSTELEKNFCFLVIGTLEEKFRWLYQTQKLVVLSSFLLAECDLTSHERKDLVLLTSLAMRFMVSLTDLKGWKGLNDENSGVADNAVRYLIKFMASEQSGTYNSIQKYIMKNHTCFAAGGKTALANENAVVTASVISLCLRPLHLQDIGAYEQYITCILTIPYLIQRIPSIFLPALKHASVLLPCLGHLMTSKDKIFGQIQFAELKFCSAYAESISCFGWALSNITNIVTEYDNDRIDSGHFVLDVDFKLYVDVINVLSEKFISSLENSPPSKIDNDDSQEADSSSQGVHLGHNKVKTPYMDLLKPVHQQWYLRRLLSMLKKDIRHVDNAGTATQLMRWDGNLELQDIVLLYYNMLRIYTLMNPLGGVSPILNLLAFAPEFLLNLWEQLEYFISGRTSDIGYDCNAGKDAKTDTTDDVAVCKKQRHVKDSGSKWVNVLQKITGKSVDVNETTSNEILASSSSINEDADEIWNIEPMRQGSQGILKDLSCMLHLFCATYAHLLLVLDDIEFYEKQVPFTLQQQRWITAVLNTFVYNSLTYNSGKSNKALIDAAVKCLHLLYERDCRHKFCPPSLWLAPARKGCIPIAAAARVHETAFANLQIGDALNFPSMSSVLTTVPHVYPFEERVRMFREFIKLDKSSRRSAGEVSGSGSAIVQIVIHRDHIVEDGFRQLHGIGSRLKSSINVSFVSESGLPEAGLDYGGLSKEFLTDLSRAAFDPRYGLFCQSPTAERYLTPNLSARFKENGMEKIEFLGRVVGKALYEGILLDYSFSLVFVQKLLGRYSFLDELSTLDPELYKSLMIVKHFDGDVADLTLDFTITEELQGRLVVTELKPSGKNISVTNENKLQYVHAIADYKLNRQILPFANAFYRGLIDLISPAWLSIFNANEFNQLLSGGHHDIDVDDLRAYTKYTGGYSEGSRTVKLFWEVVKGFKPNERCMLLKFVTSCSRAPLLGFKHLQPSFTIHKVPCDMPLWATIGGQDVDRLPSASTCYSTLKLPTYKRSSTLRNKLLYAISSNSGFELS